MILYKYKTNIISILQIKESVKIYNAKQLYITNKLNFKLI